MNEAEVKQCWEANAEAWTVMARQGYDRFRDLFNTPTFMRILPDVKGLCGIDIGCGEGHNTRLLARFGAKMTALDIAPTFIRYAREAEVKESLGITYCEGTAIRLPFAEAQFDFATAFMSMQDIAGGIRPIVRRPQAGTMRKVGRLSRLPGTVGTRSGVGPGDRILKKATRRDKRRVALFKRLGSLLFRSYLANSSVICVPGWNCRLKMSFPNFWLIL